MAHARNVNSTALPTLRPRTVDEPEPDLTGIVLVHRAIRADLGRLTARLDELVDGREPAGAGQVHAIRRYTAALLAEISRHQEHEDEIVWPVLAIAALQAIDLGPLTDDHQAIAAMVDRVSQAVGSLPELRDCLGELRDVLDEQMADEERQVFPVMRRYVQSETCRWCERQSWRRTTLARLRFTVPWLARHARADELNCLLADGGWRARVLLAAARPGYARLERLALGARVASLITKK